MNGGFVAAAPDARRSGAIRACVNEKPSIEALERTQGDLKLPNGRALTRHSHDHKRHGTTSVLAAFEVATRKGKVASRNRLGLCHYSSYPRAVARTSDGVDLKRRRNSRLKVEISMSSAFSERRPYREGSHSSWAGRNHNLGYADVRRGECSWNQRVPRRARVNRSTALARLGSVRPKERDSAAMVSHTGKDRTCARSNTKAYAVL
jgi:hypothetical protein